jgi:hypothetical protein
MHSGRSCAGGRTGPRAWPRVPSPRPCRPRSRPARAPTGRTQPKLRQRAPEQDRPQPVAECAQPLRGQHQPHAAGQPLPASHAGSRPSSCARRQCSFRPSNIGQVIESTCSSAATIDRLGRITSSPDASGASCLVGQVGFVHDPGQFPQHRIRQLVAAQDRLERTVQSGRPWAVDVDAGAVPVGRGRDEGERLGRGEIFEQR